MTTIIDSLTGSGIRAYQLSTDIHGFAQFWTIQDDLIRAEEINEEWIF